MKQKVSKKFKTAPASHEKLPLDRLNRPNPLKFAQNIRIQKFNFANFNFKQGRFLTPFSLILDKELMLGMPQTSLALLSLYRSFRFTGRGRYKNGVRKQKNSMRKLNNTIYQIENTLTEYSIY
ncbi:MAG: hypothetical protein ACYC2P_03910 [Paludibacteraceae bacterium]